MFERPLWSGLGQPEALSQIFLRTCKRSQSAESLVNLRRVKVGPVLQCEQSMSGLSSLPVSDIGSECQVGIEGLDGGDDWLLGLVGVYCQDESKESLW